MRVLQTMQWRRRCQVAVASRRYSRPAGAFYTNASNMRCSKYRVSTTLLISSPTNVHRRSFSISADEVVVHPPPAAKPVSSDASQTEFRPQIHVDIPRKKNAANNKLLIELQGAHELFHQVQTEAKSLLHNIISATTSDEVVATTDYFLILVNSLDLEKSLDVVQSLQSTMHEKKQEEEGTQSINNSLTEEEVAVKEKLHQAIKSMSQLHHVFLTMVESSLPLNSPPKDVEFPMTNELYSAMTVGRALQLSRRAEELGMPMHRPLFQRLAMGIVLTSSPPTSVSPPGIKEQIGEPPPPTSLILPGQFQQIKEGLHRPPLALDLIGIFQHARSALKITSLDELQQLAEDLLAGPLLTLMKQRQYEECMGLLRGWRELFGHDGVTLISLLGEKNTLDILEIAKGWLVGGPLEDDAKNNPYVMELTSLLEVSLSEMIKQRKHRAEKLSHLLWLLSIRNNAEDEDVEEDSADFEDKDVEDFGEESDSDSDFEDDFDCGDGEEQLDTPTQSSPPDLTLAEILRDEGKTSSNSRLNSFKATHIDSGTTVSSYHLGEERRDESTIIKGLSDKEVRRSIYLRNGAHWALADVVQQLEDWNKGRELTFTHEFERYLGRQIMKRGDKEDDQ